MKGGISMQVQVISPIGTQYNIESDNPETILRWIGEYVPRMTEKGWQMRVWLSRKSEALLFGEPYMVHVEWDEKGIANLENFFRRAGQQWRRQNVLNAREAAAHSAEEAEKSKRQPKTKRSHSDVNLQGNRLLCLPSMLGACTSEKR